jgi:hypothetical protein
MILFIVFLLIIFLLQSFSKKALYSIMCGSLPRAKMPAQPGCDAYHAVLPDCPVLPVAVVEIDAPHAAVPRVSGLTNSCADLTG